MGFSGGKDSLATLSLACKLRNRGVLKRVDAYFMYLVPNLRCLEPKVDLICRKFDVQLWKVPHWNLSRRFKNGILMPHLANTNKLREFRPTDLEDYLRKQTKIEWYAYGHRREDSLERRGMLTSCLGFNEVSRRVYPLWTWGRRYLNAYLKREGLRPPRIIGGVRTGGRGTW